MIRPARNWRHSCFAVLIGLTFSCPSGIGQTTGDANQSAPAPQTPETETHGTPGQTQEPANPNEPPGGKRVLGVLPNYRTANASAIYTPLTVKQKFVIGTKDSFDYPLLLLGAAFAGIGQLTDQHPPFGQGVAGFARRFGTAYADQAIGNMMTEAIYPSLLHEDPRYFRKQTGSKWGRTWYALTRVMVTHTDSGGTRFNYSEWLGNATAAAISNAYYPDGRDVADNVYKLLEEVATDAISQVLKEFWPDVKQRYFHRHNNNGPTADDK